MDNNNIDDWEDVTPEPMTFVEPPPSDTTSQADDWEDVEEPSMPVDMQAEMQTESAMDKFLADTGDVLGRVASVPGDILSAGQFAIDQTPKELQKIGNNPLAAAKAAGLAPAVSQNLNALIEKGIGKLDPTLNSEEYQNLYGSREVSDIAKENRAAQQRSTEDFPLTSMASKLATSTALAAPAIAAAPAALAAAAPTLAYGALAGAEAGEQALEETGSPEMALRAGLKSAATQGLTDAATFGVGRLAKSRLQKLKDIPALQKLKNISETQTLKSIGATTDDIAGLQKRGKSPEAIAKQLEESGVLRTLQSKSRAAERLDDAISSESSKLDDIVKTTSSNIKPEDMSTIVDDIARTAEENILVKLARESGISDPDHPIVKDLQRKIQELRNVGADDLISNRKLPTFEQIHNKKKEFGDAVKSWEPGRTGQHQKALRDLYGIVNEGLDMATQRTAAGNAYKVQNDKLSKLFTAKDLADPKGDPQILAGASSGTLSGRASSAMRRYGPAGAVASAITGAAVGGPGVLLAAPVVYGAAKYGRSAVAAGARGVEKVANFGAQNAEKLINAAKTQFPDVYNKFAPVLDSASKRGTAAISATNYMLSQQFPEYREMLEKIKESEENSDFETVE